MKKEEQQRDKRVLTMLILMFPSLLLGAVAGVELPYVAWLGLTILILMFQFVLVRNFVEDFYGY